jgi:hypothetical protein
MPSPSTSSPAISKAERYGVIHEVHFTIHHNKSGWYVTEYLGGAPLKSHGPLEGPLTTLDAMSFLIANHTLNQ